MIYTCGSNYEILAKDTETAIEQIKQVCNNYKPMTKNPAPMVSMPIIGDEWIQGEGRQIEVLHQPIWVKEAPWVGVMEHYLLCTTMLHN